jgi:pentatricopeptide repeat protein
MQANELDLALDVYRQLLQDGCTPNLVTYNILIDVHGKTGQWQEAVKVLDALDLQVHPHFSGLGPKSTVGGSNILWHTCHPPSCFA